MSTLAGDGSVNTATMQNAEILRQQLVEKFNQKNRPVQQTQPGRLATSTIAALNTGAKSPPADLAGKKIDVVKDENSPLLSDKSDGELTCCQKIINLCCPCFAQRK